MSIKKITIYHNPRCRKSRETLELLQHHCKDIEIVDYLKTPPSKHELKKLIDKLGIKAEELVRKGEALYKDNYKGHEYSKEEWLMILAENPILMERPVVVAGEKAVIGRPPENVLKLL